MRENGDGTSFRDFCEGGGAAVGFEVYVEGFIHGGCSFRGEGESLPAFATDLFHLFRTEELRRIDPTFGASSRADFDETAADIDDTDAVAVVQHSDGVVLGSQFAAKV
jgi:hypothetical protein